MHDRSCDADRLHHAVLTGAGSSFSVGADLMGPDTLTKAIEDDVEGRESDSYREPAGRISEVIASMRIPVIGAINGDAVGGGATILSSVDYRVASADARIGFVFPRRGLAPEGAVTWFLPRLIGHGRAADWLLSGRLIPADKALAAGYHQDVCPPGEVVSRAVAHAQSLIAHTSAYAVAETKQLLRQSWTQSSLVDQSARESQLYERMAYTDDGREGILSFLERRRPAFTSSGREKASPS